MLLLQLKNCHLIFRFYPLPFPVASQSSARAVSTHALSERMKEMSERIEAMDQITQNMDREFKSSRVVSTRLIYQQNGNVSWRRRAQIKQLTWPMSEWQIGHRKFEFSPFRALTTPRLVPGIVTEDVPVSESA